MVGRGQEKEGREKGIGVKYQGSEVSERIVVKSYRDLEVWQKSMDLVIEWYKNSRNRTDY